MAHCINRIVRISEICDRIGVCRSTYYNWVKDGLLPEPIAVGSRLRGMPESELDRLLAAQIAGRSDAEIKGLVKELKAARKTADQGGEEKRPAVPSPGRKPALNEIGRTT
jgi:prophage regulatory protein